MSFYIETTQGRVGRAGCEKPVGYKVYKLGHPVPVIEDYQKICWGKPAQITQALLDHDCPRCSAKPQNETGLHFDIGREDGQIFGALCHNCGWSF